MPSVYLCLVCVCVCLSVWVYIYLCGCELDSLCLWGWMSERVLVSVCLVIFYLSHRQRDTDKHIQRETQRQKETQTHRETLRRSLTNTLSLTQSRTITHFDSLNQRLTALLQKNFFSPIICDMLMKNPNFSVTFRVDTLWHFGGEVWHTGFSGGAGGGEGVLFLRAPSV